MSRDKTRGLLLIDDEPAQSRLITAIATRAGWRVIRSMQERSALAILADADASDIEAILIDSWSPDGGCERLVDTLHRERPDLPIIIITARNSAELAVAAMRAGACDFLIKPIAPDRLLAALDSAAEISGHCGELRPLTEKLPQTLAFAEVVGSSPNFRAALAVAAKAARARVPVLIEGESGTGKELIAQAIHMASPRAHKPLVAVNCGAIAQGLIESELFGHEKGAFTGAFDRQLGRFAVADSGTILLDEIADLPMDAQVKLLRVLQSGEIQPIGARFTQQVDVRIIAATNRKLSDEVAAGRFREDLYYRLAVVQVHVPSLRERRGDIPDLARHLLHRIQQQLDLKHLGITDEALNLLMDYEWPGNVRQLHNVLFRAAIFCETNALTERDFPNIAMGAASAPRPLLLHHLNGAPAAGVTLFQADGHIRALEDIEADVIRLAIGHYRGRMTEVARRLGIGRSTLYRKLGELGIDNAAA